MPIEIVPILFVVTRGESIGGAQIHVRDLAYACAERGVKVAVAVGTAGALTEALAERGIPSYLIPHLIRSVNPFGDIQAIKELRRAIRDFKPGLVSAHTAKAGMVGRIAAAAERIPSIFTAHGWQFADGIGKAQKAAVLAVEYLCARLCRRIVTVSRYDYDLALRYRVAGRSKLRLVRNGMPERALPDHGVRAATVPCRLIMTARFQEQKDHDTLLEALAGLTDLDWTLRLVGDGPLLPQVRSKAEALGLASRIEFLGQRLDVPDLLDRSDVFVLATKWEGFPRSILEAMRAGLPVVASDVGGCKESVEDGVTGFLVPPRDAAALGLALSRLISDPEESSRIGAEGRRRFDESFTFRAMFEATSAVWREAIEERR